MTSQPSVNDSPQANTPPTPPIAYDRIESTLDKFASTASVDSVYGDPVTHDDTILIPAAEVMSTLGFGFGFGPQPATGSGGGGGGAALARPVAAIVITRNHVRVKPIVDVTKIALAALTTAGFMVGMVARMSSRRAPRFR